jgi:RimJ/RimL family protein N-acetyltransferase
VHPGATDTGIGRRLLGKAIAWARDNPRLEKIELHVRSGNARAMHLYESVGFVEEGRLQRRLKLADGGYVDDVVMGLFVDGDGG